MSKDLRLRHLLDEINAYIDNMPLAGSPEYLRFTEALAELLAHVDAVAKLQFTPERDSLGGAIKVVLRRFEREKNAKGREFGFSSARPTRAPNVTGARSKQ